MDDGDSKLVDSIRAGDDKAFEKLFFKYYESLTHFACHYVDSVDIAEGFVQEAYANVWDIRREISSDVNIRSYLYSAVKNQALDYIKHHQVVQKYEKEVELRFYEEVTKIDDRRFRSDGFIEKTQDVIEQLPRRTRHIYKLSRNEGFTYKEIANILEISIKTVESHISKALRILRQKLANYLPVLVLIFFDLMI